jgi:hypothetical protein
MRKKGYASYVVLTSSTNLCSLSVRNGLASPMVAPKWAVPRLVQMALAKKLINETPLEMFVDAEKD